jgi:hypothetical protein
MGGDWDSLEKRFEELDVYQAFQQVCLEGLDWSETVFYQQNLEKIEAGHLRWGCKTKREFDQRCEGLELLFRTIQRNGYKSQRQLMATQGDHDPWMAENEVIVSIGRHGDLLFSDGAHRLSIAKLLGLPQIPVLVAVRHTEWVSFRQELLEHARQTGSASHEPLTHPDLDDIPIFAADEDRFAMIRDNMSAQQGRLLDVGSNLGYFCHRFEAAGFDCWALEESPERYQLLAKLRRAENGEFLTIPGSVLECQEIRDTSFSVTLALNILHRYLEPEDQLHKLVEFLGHLETEELFFEPPPPGQPDVKSGSGGNAPEDLVEFLLANSKLENAACIGTTRDGTPLYRLY